MDNITGEEIQELVRQNNPDLFPFLIYPSYFVQPTVERKIRNSTEWSYRKLRNLSEFADKLINLILS